MTETEWRASVDTALKQIDRRLNAVETKNAVDEVHRQNVEKRLEGIETNMQWLVRLILGAIIMAIIAFMLNGGFIAG